ncbi:CYFA0S01e10022g1_1 [Cyberlindnera fabianii]|uniref:Ceramide glucosyltransferase n=1 Tax=Cyberlindnera fabianii TaxID=36022 RepID=A0A061ARL9_CYBFA|nr:CYFA0S01e10022g1_1 [Cyberlindnera fabianii]
MTNTLVRRVGAASLIAHLVTASIQERATIPTSVPKMESPIIVEPEYTLSGIKWVLSWIGLIWWIAMALITTYGFTEILMKFNSPKYKPQSVSFDSEGEVIDSDELEGVTILRPVKGIDTEMELCLESCLQQRYPKNKMQVLFCVEDASDPAVPVIQALIQKYSKSLSVQLLIDQDYVNNHFGPNPKINNLAKGFTAAKFDIVWVIDSNVWVSPGTLLRSVTALKSSTDNGRRTTNRPVRIVHHVPLALSTSTSNDSSNLGARLDEMFLHTSHAKFYVFFNKASFAVCVNGKSNMYRISDLDRAVVSISKGENKVINNKDNIAAEALEYVKNPKEGIRFFSRYIGEDNMIGIAIWEMGGRTGMTGDVVCQPLGGVVKNGIMDYVNRRVRWLRVRKYMVLAATLIEPTTESLVIGVFGSYGISNLFLEGKGMWWLLALHELVWCCTDYVQTMVFMKYSSQDQLRQYEAPFFLHYSEQKLELRYWLPIWILRELLALPIWIIAMLGHEIDWRNRPFKINADLSAEEL